MPLRDSLHRMQQALAIVHLLGGLDSLPADVTPANRMGAIAANRYHTVVLIDC
jgi:hypothetical protein